MEIRGNLTHCGGFAGAWPTGDADSLKIEIFLVNFESTNFEIELRVVPHSWELILVIISPSRRFLTPHIQFGRRRWHYWHVQKRSLGSQWGLRPYIKRCNLGLHLKLAFLHLDAPFYVANELINVVQILGNSVFVSVFLGRSLGSVRHLSYFVCVFLNLILQTLKLIFLFINLPLEILCFPV